MGSEKNSSRKVATTRMYWTDSAYSLLHLLAEQWLWLSLFGVEAVLKSRSTFPHPFVHTFLLWISLFGFAQYSGIEFSNPVFHLIICISITDLLLRWNIAKMTWSFLENLCTIHHLADIFGWMRGSATLSYYLPFFPSHLSQTSRSLSIPLSALNSPSSYAILSIRYKINPYQDLLINELFIGKRSEWRLCRSIRGTGQSVKIRGIQEIHWS